MLPTFVIAGAQKSGTTSLHRYLAQHPEIYIPPEPQEICFFCDDTYPRGLDYYEQYFQEADRGQIVGQTCPVYISAPEVPARIAKALPEIRLIFILRHPVDRTYSHYWHNVKKGREPFSFEEALVREPARIERDAYHALHFCYRLRSRYPLHIQRFLTCFSRKQMHIVLTEEMARHPQKTLKGIYRFLGISTGFEADVEKHNVASLPRFASLQEPIEKLKQVLPRVGKYLDLLNRTRSYPPMDPLTREALHRDFESDVQQLQDMMGIDLSEWRVSEEAILAEA